jgi:hypothetical protein
MNLDGITSLPNGKCGDVFPATTQLAEGQVLNVTAIVEGLSCNGQLVEHGPIVIRYCNSGKFDPTIASKCIFPGKQVAKITGTTSVFIPVAVEVSPETVNVKCSPNKDQGDVRFTIFGGELLDVTRINQSSLQIEGVPLPPSSCDSPTFVNSDTFPDLTCQIPSCPDLGPALAGHKNADGTVDITIMGSLMSGTAILGEDRVKTSP